jgi:hypothetical protein
MSGLVALVFGLFLPEGDFVLGALHFAAASAGASANEIDRPTARTRDARTAFIEVPPEKG